MIVLFVGCTHQNNIKDGDDDIEIIPPINKDIEDNQPSNPTDQTVLDEQGDKGKHLEVQDGIDVGKIIDSLSLEEKVAQLFVVDFYTFNNNQDITEMTDSLKEKIQTYPIGGFIYFSNNVVNREQVINLNHELQRNSYIPLFIAVDEEGGTVRRLGNNPAMNMTDIPTASVIGEAKDLDYAYDIGTILGEELKVLGFNMDFAPIADINTNPDNPVIGDRAYGNQPQLVSDMVVSVINGLQDQNIAAVAKHFPGHGDTSFDTHTGDVYVEHDIVRLREAELIPFQNAVENNVTGIMVAHIILPRVTGNDDPATLSSEIINDILREELGFEGLVFTDSFIMKAISKRYSPDEACIKALNAGVDIIVMPSDFEVAYEGVIEAVVNGDISMERINKSVKRILEAKMKLGLIEGE